MRMFQKCKDTESYSVTLVNHDFSSRQHTRQVYRDAVLKFATAQLSKYTLPVRVQGRRLGHVTKQLENRASSKWGPGFVLLACVCH